MLDTKAARLLDEFELTSKLRTPASNLSRGMRQKLAICCAYLHDPQAILFDEPLTGLDPQGIRVFKRSLQRARGTRRRGDDQLAHVGDGRGLVHARLDPVRRRAAILRTDRRACGRASTTSTRPRAWRTSSSPPHPHDNDVFHPATVQLLRLQSRGRRRRMWQRFCQPRRLVLSAVACVLAVVWLGNAAMTVWLREAASAGNAARAACRWDWCCTPAGISRKRPSFAPKARLTGRPPSAMCWPRCRCSSRDLVAYQLASVTVTTMLKAGLFTLCCCPICAACRWRWSDCCWR